MPAVIGSNVSLANCAGNISGVRGYRRASRTKSPHPRRGRAERAYRDRIPEPCQQRRRSSGGQEGDRHRWRRYGHRRRSCQQTSRRRSDRPVPAHASRNAGHRAGDRWRHRRRYPDRIPCRSRRSSVKGWAWRWARGASAWIWVLRTRRVGPGPCLAPDPSSSWKLRPLSRLSASRLASTVSR